MVTVIVSIGADTEELVTSERMRNLRTSLTALRQQTLPRDRYRVVLVEQGPAPQVDASILPLVDQHVFAYNPQRFNRSWGRNVGAMSAAPGVICTLDADIVVPSNFLLRGFLAWQCGARAIRPFSAVLYMDRESTQDVHEHLLAGRPIDCESSRYRGGLHLNSKGGCIWTDLRLYLELGGHDERFEGWGNEDNEFWDRLTARTPIVRLDGQLLHLYHERPFEKTQETRENGILWRVLQHGLLPPPRTRVIGDLDRYRRMNGGEPNSVAQQAIVRRPDPQRQQLLRESIVQEATRVCRQERRPDDQQPQGLRLRALLASRKGDDNVALACLTGVLKLDPFSVGCLMDIGRILLRKRRASEALAAQLRAVVVAPGDAAPYRELGRVLYRAGRLSEATLAYQEALQLDLGDAQTLAELGEVFRARGYLDKALGACELARKLDPESLDGYLLLGRVRLARQEWESARDVFQQGLVLTEAPKSLCAANRAGRSPHPAADPWSFHVGDNDLDNYYPPRTQLTNHGSVASDPRHAALHVGMGDASLGLGMVDEATESFQRALNLSPNDLEASRRLVVALEALGRRNEAVGAWVSLGDALEVRHRLDEAVVAYRQAAGYKPDCLRALTKLGRLHAARGRLTAAIDCFERALAIDPEQPLAHPELARALSTIGQTDRSWRECAWWCRPLRLQARSFTQPLWHGARLDGKTLLVWADQELGDTIQWLRHVPVLEQLGARVIVECQPRLAPLARTMTGIQEVVGQGAPLPAFDVHAPLTLLPVVSLVCRSTPCRAPYFKADTMLVDLWRRRLNCTNGAATFTAGLCWAGHPDGINRAVRFAPLTAFAPLTGLPHVRFISLQMGPPTCELFGPPAGLHVEHLQDDSCSASDTAALMESLDLIVTVDTMVAHLAGALGRPVWLALPSVADWRWLQHRDDTSLYPTMRLFRQAAAGDWKELFSRVRTALEEVVEAWRRASRDLTRTNTDTPRIAVPEGRPTLAE